MGPLSRRTRVRVLSNITHNASSDKCSGRCLWYVRRRGQVLVGFWCGSMRGRDQLEHRRRWQDNIKMGFQERLLGWTRSIWIRIGKSIFERNNYITSYILPQIQIFAVWRTVTVRRRANFLLTYGSYGKGKDKYICVFLIKHRAVEDSSKHS